MESTPVSVAEITEVHLIDSNWHAYTNTPPYTYDIILSITMVKQRLKAEPWRSSNPREFRLKIDVENQLLLHSKENNLKFNSISSFKNLHPSNTSFIYAAKVHFSFSISLFPFLDYHKPNSDQSNHHYVPMTDIFTARQFIQVQYMHTGHSRAN